VKASDALRALRDQADPARAAVSLGFFKTGPGEYGEGDRFLGLTVPQVRRLASAYRDLPHGEIRRLLRDEIHEARLLALCILVERYGKADSTERERIYRLYLDEIDHVNNWDLVDASAPYLVGVHLLAGDRALLTKLADSPILWRRRIAIVSTWHFIRNGEFEPTLMLCDRLLDDPRDLMHKACGWMLRELGKRDSPLLEGWLEDRATRMPRTMLRYAIERLAPDRRRYYLGLKAARSGKARIRQPA
jgi:3-methyladenine DNA glycosylase AlkD